jgi:hypothetical protein
LPPASETEQEKILMRFKLRDIEPNPFRDMARYVIDRQKVQALKASMDQTTFWDNIVARKVKGKAQIAYGHHRLIALKEKYDLDYEVNLIIRDLSDTEMIRVMANENMEEWSSSPAVEQETVRAVVLAYAEGKIELDNPDKAERQRPDRVRYAPYFTPGSSHPACELPYTPETIANFLGWVLKGDDEKTRPKTCVHTALTALQAEEEIGDQKIIDDLNAAYAADTISRKEHADIIKEAKEAAKKEPTKAGAKRAAREKVQDRLGQAERDEDWRKSDSAARKAERETAMELFARKIKEGDLGNYLLSLGTKIGDLKSDISLVLEDHPARFYRNKGHIERLLNRIEQLEEALGELKTDLTCERTGMDGFRKTSPEPKQLPFTD